jgi:hypothetical protein
MLQLPLTTLAWHTTIHSGIRSPPFSPARAPLNNPVTLAFLQASAFDLERRVKRQETNATLTAMLQTALHDLIALFHKSAERPNTSIPGRTPISKKMASLPYKNKLAIASVSLGMHATHSLPEKILAASRNHFSGIEIVYSDLEAWCIIQSPQRRRPLHQRPLQNTQSHHPLPRAIQELRSPHLTPLRSS